MQMLLDLLMRLFRRLRDGRKRRTGRRSEGCGRCPGDRRRHGDRRLIRRFSGADIIVVDVCGRGGVLSVHFGRFGGDVVFDYDDDDAAVVVGVFLRFCGDANAGCIVGERRRRPKFLRLALRRRVAVNGGAGHGSAGRSHASRTTGRIRWVKGAADAADTPATAAAAAWSRGEGEWRPADGRRRRFRRLRYSILFGSFRAFTNC